MAGEVAPPVFSVLRPANRLTLVALLAQIRSQVQLQSQVGAVQRWLPAQRRPRVTRRWMLQRARWRSVRIRHGSAGSEQQRSGAGLRQVATSQVGVGPTRCHRTAAGKVVAGGQVTLPCQQLCPWYCRCTPCFLKRCFLSLRCFLKW